MPWDPTNHTKVLEGDTFVDKEDVDFEDSVIKATHRFEVIRKD
jgi:hypothetical protein